MTPSFMKTTLADTSRAKAISCVTTSMVMPSAARPRMTCSTSPTISGSRALVGSSKSSISGSMASALAMATRCFMPPDICRGLALMYGAMPTRSRYFMALASASSLERLSTFICPTTQFFSTLMLSKRLKLWNTMPTLARYLLGFTLPPMTLSPWKSTSPLVGVSSRLMHLSSVLLPEPEAPMMLVTSPGCTSKSMSRSTSLEPKLLERWRTSSMASLIYLSPLALPLRFLRPSFMRLRSSPVAPNSPLRSSKGVPRSGWLYTPEVIVSSSF